MYNKMNHPTPPPPHPHLFSHPPTQTLQPPDPLPPLEKKMQNSYYVLGTNMSVFIVYCLSSYTAD